MIIAMMNRGVDVDAASGPSELEATALFDAVEKPSILTALLLAGADPNIENAIGWTPLSWALRFEPSSDAVLVLLDFGANPNVHTRERNAQLFPGTGVTPLMIATQSGSNADELRHARLLLNYGAKVDAQDSEGRTALLWAVKSGNADLVRLLVSHGADVLHVDSQGQSITDVAQSELANPQDSACMDLVSGLYAAAKNR